MRSYRSILSIFVVFAALCGVLLLAGCGGGGSISTPPVITLPTPTLAFVSISSLPYGSAPFVISATSNSSGAITYSVTSGPATVSDNVLSLTGIGTVQLLASQAATSSYATATATTSFQVTQGTTTLNFAAIATQIATNVPFTVSATSAATGAVTYAVTSGPATLSGNRLTLTGATGTVNLSASQAATTNYAAATANTSFSVVLTGAVAGTSFGGTVQATGLPVIGASVQLYDAGTSGNGSQANPRLSSVLTTDASGNFTVPSSFSCEAAGTVLYLIAKGGKVSSTGTVNNALWLTAPLPPCGSLTNSMSFTLNEATTVATAAALAQFYSAGGNIGATASNTLGVSNGILTAGSLTNMSTGVSPGASVPSNVTVSSEKLNTLANALTACVVSSTACTPLFTAATAGGTAPTNTLDAAFNIARNPANSVAAIYALSVGTTFTPVLAAQPADWIMFLTISGGGLHTPTAVGVDGSGNLWAANYSGALSAFTPSGSPIFSSGITGSGLHESFGMAIDAGNNIWVENDETPGSPRNGGSISKFTNAGVALSGSIGYTAGVYFPTGIASDSNGNMWVANYGNSTYALLMPNGTPNTTNCDPSGCGYGKLEFPVAVAADSNHFAWFANQATNTLTRISPDGAGRTSLVCCNGASGMAVDEYNVIWVANYFGDSVSEIANNGTVVSTGYTGGGIYHPQGIAVDGAGSIWIANYRGGSLTKLAGSTAAVPGAALSPATIGLGSDAGLIEPYGVTLDASGNAWLSNYAPNTIVEFVGVAVPVKMPLVGPVQIP